MTVVAMGDFHCPFHDIKAIRKVIKHIKAIRPKTLVLLGDFIDCYRISRFIRDPKSLDLYGEIEAGNELLDTIQNDVPGNTDIVWLDGNHEYRMKKYVWGKVPELDGLISVEKHMGLKERGIKYYRYGTPLVIDGVILKHGAKLSNVSAGYSVKKEMDVESASVIMGHTHRLALIYRSYRTHTIFGVEAGHLCDMSRIDYLQDAGGTANWQQGAVELASTRAGLQPKLLLIDAI